MAIAAIMLMMVVVCVVGCHKPDDPNNGDGNENNSEIINSHYVPIDWDNATLLSTNDSVGDYQIQFSGEVPELQPGSVIAIREGVDVRYAFVETVSVDGNTVSMTTSEAYLTDIFANTEFTLATNPNRRSSANGKVFYPVAAYMLDEQGNYRTLDLTVHREDGWGFTHDLWQIDGDFDNHIIHSSSHDSIIFKKLNFNLDIDLEMYMNFSGRDVHEIVNNAIDRYRSRALNINAYLLGTFNTEQMLRCKIFGNLNWNPGYEIWKHNLFNPISIEFVVEGVPVVITVNSDLYRQVQVTGNGDNITAITGFTDHAQGRAGFQWTQTGGISPEATFSNTFELAPPPTLEGKGTVTAKVWAIPRIRLILYHTLGPSFDFKPYLSNVVSGGFNEEMLGQSNDFCAWSLDCNAGLDAAVGLSLQFMGYEVQNYSTPNWNIINKSLYHSPLRIEHNAAKGGGMKLGQRNEVNFTVYDRNHLFNMDVITPLPQFVKFEGDGDISFEYGIAQEGIVSVDWTPLSDGDVLYARLYDIEGNVISEAEVGAEITVTTAPVTDIAQTTATGGGSIEANDYVTVEDRGLCWNTAGSPTIANNHADIGTGTGSFTVNMTGLTENTTYHVRAFAYLCGEYYYGNEVSFTTEQEELTGDWVDLGLPSGLLWSTRNVGASSPEDYGDYFAWGETQPKDIYNLENYLYAEGTTYSDPKLTKYCTQSDYGNNGFTDNLITLLPEDDAATANYGGRMPTKEEWKELRNKCISVWTTQNGVNGMCFTGPNGNTLFLPAAGCRSNNSFSYVGSSGYYWSSSLFTDSPYISWDFYLSSNHDAFVDGFYGRGNGFSVRAVREN